MLPSNQLANGPRPGNRNKEKCGMAVMSLTLNSPQAASTYVAAPQCPKCKSSMSFKFMVSENGFDEFGYKCDSCGIEEARTVRR